MGKRLRAVGVLVLAICAVAWALAPAPPAAATVVKRLEASYTARVYGDFLTVGNAVLVCPPATPRCTAAMERTSATGNNNDFDMRYANGAPGLGGYDSSTARITIPPGARIAWAHLNWGGNTGIYLLGRTRLQRCDASAPRPDTPPPGSPRTEPVRLRVGGEPPATLSPRSVAVTPDGESGPHYYTALADVRPALARAATGVPVDISVADLWAPAGYGCVGGWSLTVVYDYPRLNPEHAPEARAVYVYEGHLLQRSADPATTTGISGFQVGAEAPARAGVTAYEGDFNIPGSRFAVNDTLIANPDRPGAGTGKFFDSYAAGTVDPHFPNNMSVDAKDFAIPARVVPPGSVSASLTFGTKGDTYLVQSFAFSVPIPDVLITEKPIPATVLPGERVNFDVTVTDQVDVPEHHADFTAHLAPILTDAVYDPADTHASSGTVTKDGPDLIWKGTVRPGRHVRVRFSVTIIRHPRHAARLREYMIGEGAGMSCQHGHGPGCADTTRLVLPVVVGCGVVWQRAGAVGRPAAPAC